MRYFIILLLAIVMALPSQAQTASPSFTAIIVSDINTSIAWYQHIFSLEIEDRTENADRGFKQANLAGKHWKLELIELDSALAISELLQDQSKNVRVTGLFKSGFTVKKFDAWVKHLEKLKVNFNGSVVEDPVSGKKMVIVLDPDGNRIQFFEK